MKDYIVLMCKISNVLSGKTVASTNVRAVVLDAIWIMVFQGQGKKNIFHHFGSLQAREEDREE